MYLRTIIFNLYWMNAEIVACEINQSPLPEHMKSWKNEEKKSTAAHEMYLLNATPYNEIDMLFMAFRKKSTNHIAFFVHDFNGTTSVKMDTRNCFDLSMIFNRKRLSQQWFRGKNGKRSKTNGSTERIQPLCVSDFHHCGNRCLFVFMLNN